MKEIEIKFKLENPEAVRRNLLELGGNYEGTVHEENYIYDFPDLRLKKEKKLLRLRKENDKAYLTFKSSLSDEEFKITEEFETEVSNFSQTDKILQALGFHVVWIYKKEKENWSLFGTKISIDKLPYLGWWMEIEGEKNSIKNVVRSLGFDLAQGVTKTYREIWDEYKKKYNLDRRDMI